MNILLGNIGRIRDDDAKLISEERLKPVSCYKINIIDFKLLGVGFCNF